MVLLAIFAPSNPHTLYFDHDIDKPNYIRLLSASLYNSWYNLKNRGGITYYGKNNNPNTVPLLPGHYSLETLAPLIENMFKAFNTNIPTQINQPTGAMVTYNTSGHKIMLDTDLAELFGIDRELRIINYVKRLKSPTTYFIHCDLLDKKQNLLNGKNSTVLAKFDVVEKPFEKSK